MADLMESVPPCVERCLLEQFDMVERERLYKAWYYTFQFGETGFQITIALHDDGTVQMTNHTTTL